VPVLAK